METQSNNSEPITFLSISEVPAPRTFVVYASSESVSIDGTPLQQIPLFLVEDKDTDLTDALVAGGALYTNDDGWVIEYTDAATAPESDLAILAVGMPLGAKWNIFMPPPTSDEWDEFIDLPAGTCKLCGGTGTISMECCNGGTPYTVMGDCECEIL